MLEQHKAVKKQVHKVHKDTDQLHNIALPTKSGSSLVSMMDS